MQSNLKLLNFIKRTIDSVQAAFNNSLKDHTVRELLLDQNTDAVNRLQAAFYFDLLVAGKEGDHIGSYLTSQWWKRNMIIYENILKRLDGKEKSIGHLWIRPYFTVKRNDEVQ